MLQANPDLGTIKGSDLNNEDGGGGGETALMLAINNAHDSAVKVDAKVPTVFRGEPVRHLTSRAPLTPEAWPSRCLLFVSAGETSQASLAPRQCSLACFGSLPC